MELELGKVPRALVVILQATDLLQYLQVAAPTDIRYREMEELLVSSVLIKILKIIVNRLSVRISFQLHAYHWAVFLPMIQLMRSGAQAMTQLRQMRFSLVQMAALPVAIMRITTATSISYVPMPTLKLRANPLSVLILLNIIVSAWVVFLLTTPLIKNGVKVVHVAIPLIILIPQLDVQTVHRLKTMADRYGLIALIQL